MSEEVTLVHWLRRLQTAWELDLEKLSMISHVEVATLDLYLKMPLEKVRELPAIPTGLENAMPLVSVFKSISNRLPDAKDQNEWLITENDAYENNKPIEVMAMSPQHLAWVSYTLLSPVDS